MICPIHLRTYNVENEEIVFMVHVKGPKTTYKNMEAAPGIRRYNLEHIIWVDGVIADIERAGCTISGAKSYFCTAGLRIVGFVCDADGRHPDDSKTSKVVVWPQCTNVSDIRAFIGLCVYYRIWVKDFEQVEKTTLTSWSWD